MVFPRTTLVVGISSNTLLASATRPRLPYMSTNAAPTCAARPSPAFAKNPCTWIPTRTARSAEQHLTTELAVKAFGRGTPRRSMSRNSASACSDEGAREGEERVTELLVVAIVRVEGRGGKKWGWAWCSTRWLWWRPWPRTAARARESEEGEGEGEASEQGASATASMRGGGRGMRQQRLAKVGVQTAHGCHEANPSNTWHTRDCPTWMPFFWIFQAYSGLVA